METDANLPAMVEAPQSPVAANSSTWVAYLAQNGLPAVVGGPAVAAVFRLIGGVLDIPEAWLDQRAQRIRNRTNSEKLVSETIASKAALIAASNNDLAIRASNSFVAKELRHQENKEAIAFKAIEHLKVDPTFNKGTSASETQTAQIDDDWMNYFEKFAENASSERMQELWAKVLAGEIRKVGSFSLRSIQFMATIDGYTAAIINKIAEKLIDKDFIAQNVYKKYFSVEEIYHLETCGLLVGTSGQIATTWTTRGEVLGKKGIITTVDNKIILFSDASENERKMVTFLCAYLTDIGKDIFGLVDAKCTTAFDDLIEALKNTYPNIAIYVYDVKNGILDYLSERLY